jgi:hypothetical protein
MPKLNVDENQLGLEGYDPVAYFDAGPNKVCPTTRHPTKV